MRLCSNHSIDRDARSASRLRARVMADVGGAIVFSFFKKRPRYLDQEFSDLAEMLTIDTQRPTHKRELLNSAKLNYSVDSLSHLDEFLVTVQRDKLTDEQKAVVVLRCGAYLREIVCRHSKPEFHWLGFSEVAKLSTQVGGLGMSLGTSGVLYRQPDEFAFPLGRWASFLRVEKGKV